MAGSSNRAIILVVVAMCLSSSSCAMSVIGPFGGLFSGTEGKVGTVGTVGTGTARIGGKLGPGTARMEGKVGSKLVDLKSVVCEKCAAQNWTGSVTAFNKEVPCSEAKAKC